MLCCWRFFHPLLISNALKRGESPLLIIKIFLLFFSAADLHSKQHCSEFPLRWRKKTGNHRFFTNLRNKPAKLEGKLRKKNGRRNHADTTEKPDQPAGADGMNLNACTMAPSMRYVRRLKPLPKTARCPMPPLRHDAAVCLSGAAHHLARRRSAARKLARVPGDASPTPAVTAHHHPPGIAAPLYFREQLADAGGRSISWRSTSSYASQEIPYPLRDRRFRPVTGSHHERRYCAAASRPPSCHRLVMRPPMACSTPMQNPLSRFDALRTDFSLARLRHYTGTSVEHFQPFVLFTNYTRYVDEFVRWAMRAGARSQSPYDSLACAGGGCGA